MVSKIFPADELQDSALAFARRIASVPTMAALLIKESVNQSVDQMGFYNALNACFTMHELNHAHWAWVHDNRMPMGLPDDEGIADWRTSPAGPAGRQGPAARPGSGRTSRMDPATATGPRSGVGPDAKIRCSDWARAASLSPVGTMRQPTPATCWWRSRCPGRATSARPPRAPRSARCSRPLGYRLQAIVPGRPGGAPAASAG